MVDLALRDRDRELALDRHHELEGVDRVEAEAFAEEQWSSPIVSGSSPFEPQRRDDQALQARSELVSGRGRASTSGLMPDPRVA